MTDKTIWSMCGLKEKLVNFLGSRGYFIGDSGYTQRAEIMIPILYPVGKADIAYEKAHKKCRCGVERFI